MGSRAALLLALLLEAAAFVCEGDDSCSLNGVCSSDGASCVCFAPWMGPQCASLNITAAPSLAQAAIYGGPSAGGANVTSWGGNVLAGDGDGLHHLFVTEIGGGCGLAAWGSHSFVAHATSSSGPAGPFTRRGVAVPHQSHNPQAVRYNGSWLIFHIFAGDNSSMAPCAPEPPPPAPWVPTPAPRIPCSSSAASPPVPGWSCHAKTCGGDAPSGGGRDCGAFLAWPDVNCTIADAACPAMAAAVCAGTAGCASFSLSAAQPRKAQLFSLGAAGLRGNSDWTTWVRDSSAAGASSSSFSSFSSSSSSSSSSFSSSSGGSALHRAASPNGPFEPVAGYAGVSCNNPSPWVLPNGTLVVACTWKVISAPSPDGPWTTLGPIGIAPSDRKGVHGYWEDPFLWRDARGHWHVLSHTYTREGAGPRNSISGHLFSRDLRAWQVSPTEPYGNAVTYADGGGAAAATKPQRFSTMERPKLVFDGATGEPTHLVNGVSGVYPCDTCIVGDSPPGGGCCWCKITPGEDRTFTLMQPLGR
jgi:hypothetical protein